MAIKILALDFDGVIADNSKEYVSLAFKAYERLGRKVKNPKATKRKLRVNRPYLRVAEDFYSILRLIEKGGKVTFNAIKKLAEEYPEERKEFGRNYFEIRKELMKNRDKWFHLYRGFGNLTETLVSLSKTHELFIATSRDKSSAFYITRRMGIPIKRSNVVSKEISLDKIQQMKYICKESGCLPENILFIDDSIEQLKYVKRIGTKVVLASWGFVLPSHVKESISLEIPVLALSDFDKQIKRLL